jgi:hypothetical protein
VLPLVGSTMVPPGFNRPSRSAAMIISSAGRSFDDPPGLVVSIFIASTQSIPWISLVRFSRTSGVLPMRSSTLSAIDVPCSRTSVESSPQGMRAMVLVALATSIRNSVALMPRSDWAARWS